MSCSRITAAKGLALPTVMFIGLVLLLSTRLVWSLLHYDILSGRAMVSAATEELAREAQTGKTMLDADNGGLPQGTTLIAELHRSKALSALPLAPPTGEPFLRRLLSAHSLHGLLQPRWGAMLRTPGLERISCPPSPARPGFSARTCRADSVSLDGSALYFGSLDAGRLSLTAQSGESFLRVIVLGDLRVREVLHAQGQAASAIEIISGGTVTIGQLQHQTGQLLIHSRSGSLTIATGPLPHMLCSPEKLLRLESPQKITLLGQAARGPVLGCYRAGRERFWSRAAAIGQGWRKVE